MFMYKMCQTRKEAKVRTIRNNELMKGQQFFIRNEEPDCQPNQPSQHHKKSDYRAVLVREVATGFNSSSGELLLNLSKALALGLGDLGVDIERPAQGHCAEEGINPGQAYGLHSQHECLAERNVANPVTHKSIQIPKDKRITA